jgi:transcriptional regulator with XRE-family HTH domain
MNNAEHLEIVRLYRNDHTITIKELARKFRRKPTTISRILRENGVTPQYNRTRMLNPNVRKTVLTLTLQGLTMEQIAERLKIADGSVCNIVHAHEQELSCLTDAF